MDRISGGALKGGILGMIGAIGTWFAAMAPALSLVRSIVSRSSETADAHKKANDKETTELVQRESGAANPVHLLRYVLEEDPDQKELEKEIRLVGRTQRLFQAVNDIVREEKQKPAKQRSLDVPDRIVLYIDR